MNMEDLLMVSNASSISSSWSSTTGSTQTAAATESGEDFSQVLAEVQGAGSGGSGGSQGSEQVTLSRVMPDGSLLVLLLEGNRIISETKIPASLQNLDTLLLMGDQVGKHAMEPGSYIASTAAASLLALGN